jgi:hypothetical protein
MLCRNVYKILLEDLRLNNKFRDSGVDGEIILRLILYR